MLRGVRALALWLLACACTPTPEPAAGPPPLARKIEIPPALETSEPTPATPAAPPVLAEVREPAKVACRVPEKTWSYANLRTSDGGAVFAAVVQAPVTLVLGAGEPSAPIAVLDDGEVVLRGVVARDELRLYPRSATVLGGFLVPMPRTALRWSGGAEGSLRVGVDAKAALTWPELVESDVACPAIGLDFAEFSARDAVTKRVKLVEKEVTRSGAELATERGGAPVAALRAGVRVEVVQVQGAHTKILHAASGYVVFGWVASADLGPPGMQLGYGTGYGRLAGRHVSARGGKTCARDLTLIGEVGDERTKLGTLRKNTRFQLEASEPPDPGEPPPRGQRREPRYLPISLFATRWLKLAEKARLLVAEDELRECDPPAAAAPAQPAP